jgi:4-amino-4-deoxy-L-arabinose transferase-like glycosyltransferase
MPVIPPLLSDSPPAEHQRAVRVILLATALRMLIAAVLPLGVDESYEAVVSRTLSLSYFDHPPAVFWITHAAAALGGESPLALRWPFVLLFAATSWMLFQLTARLFGGRAALWAVVSAQIIPVFSLSDGGWVLPDGPLLCASVAAALALAHAVPVSRDTGGEVVTNAWTRWLIVGIALGFAGLSKYHTALLGAGMLAFMVTDVLARRWFTRVEPYAAVLMAGLCVLPVFIWNAQHDWISFRFQGARANGVGNPLTALLQNIAGQAGYLLPWFWVPLIVLLVRGVRTGPRDRASWFCICLGAPPVLVFTLASLGGRAGLPHWPAPGYFLLLPLLGAAIARWERRAPVVARRRMTAAAGVYAALVTLVVTHAATGWLAALVPSLHTKDPAFELLEYRSLRDTLAASGLLRPAQYVAATDWLRASKIGYALGPGHPVLVFNDDMRHFGFATDVAPLLGSDGLVLMKVSPTMTPDSVRAAGAAYAPFFDTLRFVRTVPVLRGADTAITLGVFAATRLRRGWPAPGR